MILALKYLFHDSKDFTLSQAMDLQVSLEEIITERSLRISLFSWK